MDYMWNRVMGNGLEFFGQLGINNVVLIVYRLNILVIRDKGVNWISF